MTVYEAYNSTEKHQFLTEQEANDFVLTDKQVREIEIEIAPISLLKRPDWTGFKDAVFANFPLLLKCLSCEAYALLADMIISAETGIFVNENSFLIVLGLLKSKLIENGTPLTIEEIAFFNEKLALNNFSITM